MGACRCIHPYADDTCYDVLGMIGLGIFSGYSAFELRFNEPAASGL